LDSAADAFSTHGSSTVNFAILILCVTAFVWERLFHVVWVGWGFAVIATAAALLCWRRHRYGVLALAGVELAMAVLLVSFNLTDHRSLTVHLPAFLFAAAVAWIGAVDLKRGIQFARVHGRGWDNERKEVEEWLGALQGTEGFEHVTEIRERTFARGDRTYRFLDTGNFWAMAMFQTGREKKLPITYHVREHAAITLKEEPNGFVTARVGGVLIPRGHTKEFTHWRPLAPKQM
jgi:hypothetical protein